MADEKNFDLPDSSTSLPLIYHPTPTPRTTTMGVASVLADAKRQKKEDANNQNNALFHRLVLRGIVPEDSFVSFRTSRGKGDLILCGKALRGGLIEVIGKRRQATVLYLADFARVSGSKGRPLEHITRHDGRTLASLIGRELTETATFCQGCGGQGCGGQGRFAGGLNQCDVCPRAFHAECAGHSASWKRSDVWSWMCPTCAELATAMARAARGRGASAPAAAAVEAAGGQPTEGERQRRQGGANAVPVMGGRLPQPLYVRMNAVKFIGQAIRRAGLVVAVHGAAV